MKREIQSILAVVVAVMALALSETGASASFRKIQFDAGRLLNTFTDETSSPALALGAITSSDTTWNGTSVSAASYPSIYTMKYADGTTATGVSAQFGSNTTSGTGTITWNTTAGLNNTATGNAGISIYTNTMVQNIMYGNTSGSGGAVGFRVNGLTPGLYDVYVIPVDVLYLNLNIPSNIGVGVNLTQQVASPTPVTINNSTTTWTPGINYALASSVLVSSTSDWLTIVSSSNNANNPILSGIQIVQVPEPSSIALLALGGLLVRRRVRSARA